MSTPDSREIFDVAIVGAGLAGCAAAIQLARAGRRVVLFDRDTFPRDKLCGEFLSGESWHLLEQLGCASALRIHEPPAIHGMRFFSARGAPLEVQLPHEAAGVSRWLLDATLVNHAKGCGVDVRENSEITSIEPAAATSALATLRTSVADFHAKTVLATYGRFSHLDRALARRFAQKQHSFVGFKMHHRLRSAAPELDGTGEMYAFGGGYCGVCRVEGGLVNVCMLLHRSHLRGSRNWPDTLAYVGQLNPALKRRLAVLEPTAESPLAVAQVPFDLKELSLGNVFFAGDAAAMIAPLCGDGQAMALESGIRFARLLLTHNAAMPLDHAALATDWGAEWKGAYAKRLALSRVLQWALLKPAVSHAAIKTLQYLPGAAALLARVTRGSIPATLPQQLLP